MKHFPRITAILFLLLVHIPLHATPDPCELQQVAEEIRQSVLERSIQISSDEIKWAIWDIADEISAADLKQFFPKECRNFDVKGSFDAFPGMNVVRTRFTYAGFYFSCVFWQLLALRYLKELFCFQTTQPMYVFCGCWIFRYRQKLKV